MDGEEWRLDWCEGWEELRVHPVHILDDEDLALLQAWQLWRARDGLAPGMAGVLVMPGQRLLPFAGGVLDQPACVLDCLHVMDCQAAVIPSGDGGEE